MYSTRFIALSHRGILKIPRKGIILWRMPTGVLPTPHYRGRSHMKKNLHRDPRLVLSGRGLYTQHGSYSFYHHFSIARSALVIPPTVYMPSWK